jgi:hypothetical protein
MKNKPLYGTIPHSRKTWTVTHHKEKFGSGNVTSRTEGYGDFPFSEYPEIPVIDFSSVEIDVVFKALKLLNGRYVIEKRDAIFKEDGITLEQYLNEIQDLGIEILNRR